MVKAGSGGGWTGEKMEKSGKVANGLGKNSLNSKSYGSSINSNLANADGEFIFRSN